MAKFESKSFAIATNRETISEFISTPANLIEILPKDRIENWQVSDSGCSFKISGLAHISLNLSSTHESKVVYTSADQKPFALELIISISASENGSEVSITFDADVNSFMGSMLSVPLTNFLNSLGEALTKRFT